MKNKNKPGGDDLRNEIYFICLNLMEKDLEIEAYILFLSTWNFAAFRFVMTSFSLENFKKTLRNIEPLYRKLKDLEFRTLDIDKYGNEIKEIYSALASINGIKSTGTPKLMHLKNPKLFVMWDSYIRKYYGFRKGNAEDYLDFLKLMQTKFGNKKAGKGVTLARTIDQMNMHRITEKVLRK
jgi:hypothetical protein